MPPPLRDVTLRIARPGAAAGGRGREGRVREPAEGTDRGGEELADADHPLHRRGAHDDRRRRCRPGRTTRPTCSSPRWRAGELRTIAATTWSEYKKFFEKDPALARRFQLVKVEEPSEEQCALMLRGVVPALERHHSVRILDDGLEAAVRLSHRYLPDRQLPDKAVSVLDTACARLALGQSTTPPPLEDCDAHARRPGGAGARAAARGGRRRRSRRAAGDHCRAAGAHRGAARRARRALGRERELVSRIRDLRTRLEGDHESGPAVTGDEAEAARSELAALNAELDELQGDTPLMRVCVDAQLIGEVISGWTGVPVGKMLATRSAPCCGWSSTWARASSARTTRWSSHQPPRPHVAGRHRGSQQAEGRLHARRALGRRQDGDRARAHRPALRRRAQPDHHQHVGVPGGAHRRHAQGLAPGLRGLRRGRRAHRGGAAASLLRGAARRGGEGAPRRARALLPGVRQGADGGRRGAARSTSRTR